MITNEVQYRATKAHLDQFEETTANLQAKLGKARKSLLPGRFQRAGDENRTRVLSLGKLMFDL